MSEETSSQLEMQARLGQKLVSAANKLGPMFEDAKHYQGYTYTSYKEINYRLKPVLQSEGISIYSSIIGERETDFEDKKKNRVTRSVVEMEFEIVDCETGYSKSLRFVGGDQDSGGKSLSQAITECQKRFLMKLLFISPIEDDDPDRKSTELPTEVKEPAKKSLNPKRDPDRTAFQVAFKEAGWNILELNEVVKAKYQIEKGIPEMNVEQMKKVAQEEGVEVKWPTS